MDTGKLLEERKSTHGEYSEHARATQEIMRVLQNERRWATLSDIQKESMHMFAHKMARIVTGNPDLLDHWDDIAGYATLVSQRLRNPIKPIDKFDDPHHALSIAWGVTIEEARAMLQAKLTNRSVTLNSSGGYGVPSGVKGLKPTPESELVKPGTPDDGGNHDAQSELDEMIVQGISQDFSKSSAKKTA